MVEDLLKIAKEFKENPDGIGAAALVRILDASSEITNLPENVAKVQEEFLKTEKDLSQIALDSLEKGKEISEDLRKLVEKRIIEDYSKKLLGKIERIEESTSYIEGYFVDKLKKDIEYIKDYVNKKKDEELYKKLKDLETMIERIDRGMYFVKTDSDYMKKYLTKINDIYEYARKGDWRSRALLSEFHKLENEIKDYYSSGKTTDKKSNKNSRQKNMKDYFK